MKNGTIWADDAGKPIQAHGGIIIEHDGVYYWYGEDKGAPNASADGALLARVDVIGISCYSSRNLRDWHHEGVVLPATPDDPKSVLHPSRVVERPKVIYHQETGRFVLWFHADNSTYTAASVGVAVSDSPTGPFKLVRSMRPNGIDSRDMTIFKDTDGVAYLFHSSDWNRTMMISRLTDDYTDLDGFHAPSLIAQSREAPAIMLRNGTYYSVTSGCTGWDPNVALYATSSAVIGHWRLIDNPCTGPNARKTFYGQSTYIFTVGDQPYLMLDHWKPQNLQTSGYSILPITFTDDGMEIAWRDEFNGI